MQLPVVIREGSTKDYNHIITTWLKSYREYSDFARFIPTNIYFAKHQERIKEVLDRAIISVACTEEDQDQICGYAIGEMIEGYHVIHYVYVKQIFRGWKIGTVLINEITGDKPFLVTHRTKFSKRIQREDYVYDPYLFLEVVNYQPQ